MAEEGYKVVLNVYDLSQGLARQLSMSFLGKPIEAIWHTGIVVYGSEYYFGGGIQQSPAGETPYGAPLRALDLGVTHIPKEVFEDYLRDISPRYTSETYRLLSHNCNNFSNEVAQFLVGATIPDYILNLPNEVMSSPMGPLIMPMIQNLEATLRNGAVPQTSQFRPSVAAAVASSKQESTGNVKKSTAIATPSVQEPGNVAASAAAAAADSGSVQKDKSSPAADPLGDARSKVQEEIMREFTAIMASGSLRANEAAALAMRRVMDRHGRLNVTMRQG